MSDVVNKKSAEDWIPITERYVKVGHRTVVVRRYQLPDFRQVDFELISVGNIVCVLPLTTQRRVVLAKQYRPGPNQIMYELPGGLCEDNEAPDSAAARELAEETGYAGRLEFVGSMPISAYAVGQRYCFVAHDCQQVQPQQLDENEFIEVELVSLTGLRRLMRAGQLTDVSTGYLCMDWLGLLR